MRFKEIYEAKLFRPGNELAAEEAVRPVQDLTPYMEAIYLAVKKADQGHFIYRGMKNRRWDTCLIDPTNWDRRSANTTNFATLIFNNTWTGFPKRKIICTSNKGTARGYGRMFVIIPLAANASVGICPTYDMWEGFQNTLEMPIDRLNDYINRTFTAYGMPDVDDKMWQAFAEDCSQLDELIAKDPSELNSSYTSLPGKLAAGFKTGVLKYLTAMLDPKRNGFKTTTWGAFNIDYEREVWLDTPCLAIEEGVWMDNYDTWLEHVKPAAPEAPESTDGKQVVTGYEQWKQVALKVSMMDFVGDMDLQFDGNKAIAMVDGHKLGEFDNNTNTGYVMRAS